MAIMAENHTALYSAMPTWKNGTDQSLWHNTTENSSTCPFPTHWQWAFDIQIPFLWFFAAVGVPENMFVLAVLCLHKSRCTVAEIYLINLAIADLLLLCGLPFWAINIAHRYEWPFGFFLCKTLNSVLYMNMYVSIYFLVMVSIDRYLAFVKTMSLGRLRRPACAKWNCLVIWVSALLLSSPALMYRSLMYLHEYKITACILDYPSKQWEWIINTLINTVGFLIPLCVIGYCTVQIIQALRNNEVQKLKAVQTEKRATILILVVLFLFIICWLPFQITTFFDTLEKMGVFSDCGTRQALHLATQISTYCSFSNSCLNPIAYVIVGKHFRRKSKDVYHRLFLRRQSKAPSVQAMCSMDTARTSISAEWQRKVSAVTLQR